VADAMIEASIFFTPAMTLEIVTWATQRHLITRKDAAELVFAATLPRADLAAIVSLTPVVLGTPPRLQPSVLSTELVHWLTLAAPRSNPARRSLCFPSMLPSLS